MPMLRYDNLASTNDHLSSQLKAAHEALYELHTVVQTTPPAKRKENKQLLARVKGAEEVGLSVTALSRLG